MRWRSCAEWDACHGFQDNKTTDLHDTPEQAAGVCRLLEKEGLGGERIHFPVRTWVEKKAVNKLIDYRTGEILREATDKELGMSRAQARVDGGAGVIEVSDYDFPVYVEGGFE